MELVMSREQHRDMETGKTYHVIGGEKVFGVGHNIQVSVSEDARPGRPDFPACVDCGAQGLNGGAQYTAEGSFDWWPLVCDGCGSVFIIEDV